MFTDETQIKIEPQSREDAEMKTETLRLRASAVKIGD
jgi:hypothetical protein